MNRKIKKLIKDHKIRLGTINLLLEPHEKEREYHESNEESMESIIKAEKKINLMIQDYQIPDLIQINNRLNRLLKRWISIKNKWNRYN